MEARDFGEYVAIDLFTLADCYGKTQQFMNCICMASGFQLVFPVESKHPRVVWTGFLDRWLSWAGPPEKLLNDMGGEFRREMAEEAEAMGVNLTTTAVDHCCSGTHAKCVVRKGRRSLEGRRESHYRRI